MKHQIKGRKLGRNTPHRKAMLRNMVTSLLDHERIETTDTRAKELRGVAERMITLGKRGTLHARRMALAMIQKESVVSKLFSELAQRYRDREGGYTRIVKLGSRLGDNSPLSIIELVKEPLKAKGKPARKRRRKAKTKEEAAATPAKPRKKAAKEKAAPKESISSKEQDKETSEADSEEKGEKTHPEKEDSEK